MPDYKVAHLNEGGQNMIIVPLDNSMTHMPLASQQAVQADLQAHISASGLAGIVVPVWDAGGGRMSYLAPAAWHPFFDRATLAWVVANLNREVRW